MTSPPRRPMTFNVAPPAPIKSAQPITPDVKGGERVGDGPDRQQVGARVPKPVYRQLKARAALTGVTVQTLVERAIVEFLAKAE